jgi:hypothetical protein
MWVILNITITILDIIHRPCFCLKYNVSNTVFCLRSQDEIRAQYIKIVSASGQDQKVLSEDESLVSETLF